MPRIGYKKTQSHKNKHRLSVSGEKHYHAQLTNKDIFTIRKIGKKEINIVKLSMQYMVSYQTMYKIVNGYTWKYVGRKK